MLIHKNTVTGYCYHKVLFWAVETTLQLYMAESRESIREIYLEAYSHQKSAGVIYQVIAEVLQEIFQAYHPQYEAKDFYELEIASGGIIRSYMSAPCDIYFTMNEEIKKNMELSDDELEQASGGNAYLQEHAPNCPICGTKMGLMGSGLYYYYVCEPCRQTIFIEP